jgi:hypothetical protein
MEAKQGQNGVVRHRLAKADYDAEMQAGSKHTTGHDNKEGPRASDSKGVFDASQAKAALREVEDDMEADDEFEQLKRTPAVVAPVVAPTKYARNFVAGFKM